MAGPFHPFHRAAAAAVAAALDLETEFPVSEPPRPDMGDFAVGCFPAAKALKMPPAKIAALAAEKFEPTDLLASATAAGPFVNFRANRAALVEVGLEYARGERSLIPDMGAGKAVCVDFSSPNIAKQLAYHHIRSTVIGHALVKMYDALGYRAVGINHLGDWGTTHGMLLAGFELWGEPDPLDIESLNALYVKYRAAIKEQAADGKTELEDNARAWFKRLEDGDAVARERWQRFRDVSWAEFDRAYRRMGIAFDDVRGESAYEADIDDAVALFEGQGLTSISDGALIVDLTDEGFKVPLLLRKKDGATIYHTRDVAAAVYRWKTYEFEKSLYVVDRGQNLHFRQLFAALKKAGKEWADRCAHVSFGLVRLGGKKTSTRTGGGDKAILLMDVLDEAADRVRALVRANNSEIADEKLDVIAEQVGVGAVMFATLAPQRDKDVDFDWDEVVKLDGDTGPYVQYQHARACNVLRKGGVDPFAAPGAVDLALLDNDYEWAVAKKLLDMGDAVARASKDNEPHIICRYALDLSGLYAGWYSAGMKQPELRMVIDDPALQAARLALVAATRKALADSLALLGLQAPGEM